METVTGLYIGSAAAMAVWVTREGGYTTEGADEDAKEGSIKLRLRNFYLVIVAKTGDLLHGCFPRLN